MPPLGVGQAWDAEGGFLGKLNTLPSLVSQAAPPAEGGEGGGFPLRQTYKSAT